MTQGTEREEREAKVLKLAARNVVVHVTTWRTRSLKSKRSLTKHSIASKKLIEGLKQKQSCLEEKSKELETSLEFAHSSITELHKKVDAQDKAIKQLQEGVKSLTKQVYEENQRSVKLESRSRRNNLNFFKVYLKKRRSLSKHLKMFYAGLWKWN